MKKTQIFPPAAGTTVKKCFKAISGLYNLIIKNKEKGGGYFLINKKMLILGGIFFGLRIPPLFVPNLQQGGGILNIMP